MEQVSIFGRDAKVTYKFQDGLLVLFVVTFTPPSQPSKYRSIQKILAEKYGAFSVPKHSNKYILYSKRVVGRIVVQHLLYKIHNVPVEQVILFLSAED